MFDMILTSASNNNYVEWERSGSSGQTTAAVKEDADENEARGQDGDKELMCLSVGTEEVAYADAG